MESCCTHLTALELFRLCEWAASTTVLVENSNSKIEQIEMNSQPACLQNLVKQGQVNLNRLKLNNQSKCLIICPSEYSGSCWVNPHRVSLFSNFSPAEWDGFALHCFPMTHQLFFFFVFLLYFAQDRKFGFKGQLQVEASFLCCFPLIKWMKAESNKKEQHPVKFGLKKGYLRGPCLLKLKTIST